MSIYTPTYLYIKQHSVTGKLYFGKTVQDPEKYLGSGTVWKRHIKKHGKEHVVTLWYCLFYDKESITEFAISFSEQQNIVESKDWLNLCPENGESGGHTRYDLDEETRKIKSLKISQSRTGSTTHNKGIPHNETTKLKMKEAWKTRNPISEETRAKMSIAHKGNKGSTGLKESAKRIEEKRKFMIENNPTAKKITIAGVTYRSMNFAAKSLSISINRVRTMLKTGEATNL